MHVTVLPGDKRVWLGLQSIANGDFSEKELQRAKTATIATIRYNLEVPSIRTEDIARQVGIACMVPALSFRGAEE